MQPNAQEKVKNLGKPTGYQHIPYTYSILKDSCVCSGHSQIGIKKDFMDILRLRDKRVKSLKGVSSPPKKASQDAAARLHGNGAFVPLRKLGNCVLVNRLANNN